MSLDKVLCLIDAETKDILLLAKTYHKLVKKETNDYLRKHYEKQRCFYVKELKARGINLTRIFGNVITKNIEKAREIKDRPSNRGNNIVLAREAQKYVRTQLE